MLTGNITGEPSPYHSVMGGATKRGNCLLQFALSIRLWPIAHSTASGTSVDFDPYYICSVIDAGKPLR